MKSLARLGGLCRKALLNTGGKAVLCLLPALKGLIISNKLKTVLGVPTKKKLFTYLHGFMLIYQNKYLKKNLKNTALAQ